MPVRPDAAGLPGLSQRLAVGSPAGPDLGADRVAHWQGVLEACGARRAVEERVAALSHEAAGAVAGLLAHGVPEDVSAELTQLIDAYTSRRH